MKLFRNFNRNVDRWGRYDLPSLYMKVMCCKVLSKDTQAAQRTGELVVVVKAARFVTALHTFFWEGRLCASKDPFETGIFKDRGEILAFVFHTMPWNAQGPGDI